MSQLTENIENRQSAIVEELKARQAVVKAEVEAKNAKLKLHGTMVRNFLEPYAADLLELEKAGWKPHGAPYKLVVHEPSHHELRVWASIRTAGDHFEAYVAAEPDSSLTLKLGARHTTPEVMREVFHQYLAKWYRAPEEEENQYRTSKMPTIKELKKHLDCYEEDLQICYALRHPHDVIGRVHERMPADAPITPEEVAETLATMQRAHDCTIGLTWDSLEASLPESVTSRMT